MTTTSVSANPNKALWEKGDFTRIAQTMRASGDALIAHLDVGPGSTVLDLGCGDGTTAVPAARRGADVLGVDIAANLVAAGNGRAAAEGLSNLRFEEGDASHLDRLSDESFDLVVSIFGAMFAPKPTEVAKEMVRVTRPGGRIVMGNWIPGDPTLVAQILKISSAYSPPPPDGFVSPMTWGIEAEVLNRFSAAGIAPEAVTFERRDFRFELDRPPTEFLSLFRDFYGPTMNAYAAAEATGRVDDLHRELGELFASQNEGGPQRTAITASYLLVTATK
jgi:ubiquinone/menaquinone biosynthesis C-methylase UbiE